MLMYFFFFQAEDGIRDLTVTGVQTCALPIFVFVSGAEELRNAIAAIAATKFSQLSPDDTPIRILRKATFSCSIYTKDCFLVLMPVTDAVVPDPVIVSPATTN